MSVQFRETEAVNGLSLGRDPDHRLYDALFVRNFPQIYGIQWPGRSWKTCHKPLYYPLVDAHLSGTFWISKSATNVPEFFYLDFDVRQPATASGSHLSLRSGTAQPVSHEIEERVAAVIDRLGLRPGQYYLMTSPSFNTDGSCHMVLRLELRGELPFHKYGYTVLTRHVGDLCEIYPQANRKFRLPLGRDQHLVSADGKIMDYLDWRAAMHFINKLDPVSIESLPYRSYVPRSTLAANRPNEQPPGTPPANEPRRWSSRKACDELWANGLRESGRRNYAQWLLVVDCWRKNLLADDTIKEIKRWIRLPYNRCSETVKQGAWDEIDGEIERQTAWVYKHFTHYPDTVHNLRGGGLTVADLNWIAGIFRGDLINQRRLARLINYYRPRAHHDNVFIPYHRWHEIAHKRHYHGFLDRLFALDLIESDMKYFHDRVRFEFSYCRKFKLHLPAVTGEPIQRDGRNITDYDEAMFAYHRSVVEIAGATGVHKQRFYAHLERMKNKDG